MSKSKLPVKESSELPVDPRLMIEMAYELAQVRDADPMVPTYELIAQNWGLSKRDALAVIVNPVFTELFHNIQRTIARQQFDKVAYDRLIDILRNGKPRESVQAARTLADILGFTGKSGAPPVTINIEKIVHDAVSEAAAEKTVDGDVLDWM